MVFVVVVKGLTMMMQFIVFDYVGGVGVLVLKVELGIVDFGVRDIMSGYKDLMFYILAAQCQSGLSPIWVEIKLNIWL